MTHPRMSERRRALTRPVLAGFLAAAFALPGGAAVADASDPSGPPGPRTEPLTIESARELATTLGTDLGEHAAGWYYEAQEQRLVVNVLDETSAEAVRAKGADPRIVEHSSNALAAARTALSEGAAIPGTAWAADPKVNKVVVTADRTVGDKERKRLDTVVGRLGGRVVVRETAGELRPFIAGGDAIYGNDGRGRCSLGFNVVKDGRPHFLTAGHCTEEYSTWAGSPSGPAIGETGSSSFPGDDFGLVEYTSEVPHPSEVNLYDGSTQHISRAGEAGVGQTVTRSGSTSQVHDGQVTGLNATVNYQQGTVTGLIRTDVCAEPGDSGGPLFSGSTALGLTSGGNGDCKEGGETYFQPVNEALDRYGATIG